MLLTALQIQAEFENHEIRRRMVELYRYIMSPRVSYQRLVDNIFSKQPVSDISSS